jgi:hypothetical protein
MRLMQNPSEEFACLQPDPSVTGEFFRNFSRAAWRPEEKLMLAVLEDAISCLLNYRSARSAAHRRLFEQAREWIFQKEGEWLFSFDSVCSALGFDPDFLRRGLSEGLEASPRRGESPQVPDKRKTGKRKKRRKYRMAA